MAGNGYGDRHASHPPSGPPAVPSTCVAAGCDGETYGTHCPAHRQQVPTRRRTDNRAGSSVRGYGRRWRQGPRRITLERDPVCVVCHARPSTVADHHPLERWELEAAGVADPDDPVHLRGVCQRCHNAKSASNRRR